MITVAVIEDVDEIREGLESYLKLQEEFLFLSAHDSIESFDSDFDSEILPDVLIIDIGLPGLSGIAGIRIFKEKFVNTDFLVLSVFDDEQKIFDALCAGATGYLIKNTPLDKIKEAIIDLHNGGSPMSPSIARKVIQKFSPETKKEEFNLTKKEKEIVECLIEGNSYIQISKMLNNSVETIRHHIKNIYRKLHVNSKAEVISKASRGLI